MKSIITYLIAIIFVSCSYNNTNNKTSKQSDCKKQESEFHQLMDSSSIKINSENSFKLLSAFLDSCKNLPASKRNLDSFMFPINTNNISHKYHQYIEDYKIDSFKYPYVYVTVKPKLSKYEIESDWTKNLIFKLKTYGSELKIEPSVKNRVYRSFWDSEDIKELEDNYADYSEKWFMANIDSTISFIEITNEISQYDLSNVFKPQNSSIRNGVFGKNYQRIQIHIGSVKKVENEYKVNGKTKLKENIENFHGSIKPILAIYYNNEGFDISPIVILSDYEFREKNGVFKGILASFCYKDSNEYKLDTRASIADGYFNNGFVGIWKSNKTGQQYKCIWSDGRLPYTNDFDIGTGEFYPNKKYLQYGWENYLKALNNDYDAIKIEEKNIERIKNAP